MSFIVLLIITVSIFKVFKSLAKSKGLNGNRWGVQGVLTFIVSSFMTIATVAIILLVFDVLDLKSTAVSLVLIFSFILGGGIGTYYLHKMLKNKSNVLLDQKMNDFGLEEFED